MPGLDRGHGYTFTISLNALNGVPSGYTKLRAVIYSQPEGKMLGHSSLPPPGPGEIKWASQPWATRPHESIEFKTRLQPVDQVESAAVYAPKHVELCLEGKAGEHLVPFLEEWQQVACVSLDLSCFTSIMGQYEARVPVTATNASTGQGVDLQLSVWSNPSKHARHDQDRKAAHLQAVHTGQQPVGEGHGFLGLAPSPRASPASSTAAVASPSAIKAASHSPPSRTGTEPQGVDPSSEEGNGRVSTSSGSFTAGSEPHSILAPPRASPSKLGVHPPVDSLRTGRPTSHAHNSEPTAGLAEAIQQQPQEGHEEQPSSAVTRQGADTWFGTAGDQGASSTTLAASPFTHGRPSSPPPAVAPGVKMFGPHPGESLRYTGITAPYLDTIVETSSGQHGDNSDTSMQFSGGEEELQREQPGEEQSRWSRQVSNPTPITPHPSLAEDMPVTNLEHQGTSSGVLGTAVAAAAGALLAAANTMSKVVTGSAQAQGLSPPGSVSDTHVTSARGAGSAGGECGELQGVLPGAGSGGAESFTEQSTAEGGDADGSGDHPGRGGVQPVVEHTKTAGQRVVQAAGGAAHTTTGMLAGAVAGAAVGAGALAAGGAGAAASAAQLPVSAGQGYVRGVTNTAVNLAELPVEMLKAGVRGAAGLGASMLQAPMNVAESVGKGAVGLAAGMARAPVQAAQAVIQGGASATAAVAEAPLEIARHVMIGAADVGGAVLKAPVTAASALMGGLAHGTAGAVHAASQTTEQVAHAAIGVGETAGTAAVGAAGTLAAPVVAGLGAGIRRLTPGHAPRRAGKQNAQGLEPAGDEALLTDKPSRTVLMPGATLPLGGLLHSMWVATQGMMSMLGRGLQMLMLASTAALGLGAGLTAGFALLAVGTALTALKAVTSALHWSGVSGPVRTPSLIQDSLQVPGNLMNKVGRGLSSVGSNSYRALSSWAGVEVGEIKRRSVLRDQQPGATMLHALPDLLIAPVAAALPASLYEFPPGGQDVMHRLHQQQHDDLPFKVVRYNELLCGLHPPQVSHQSKSPGMIQRIQEALLYEAPSAASQAAHKATDKLVRAVGAAEIAAGGVVHQTEHLVAAASHQAGSSAAGLLRTLLLIAKNLGRLGAHASAACIAISLLSFVGIGTFLISLSAASLALCMLGARACLAGVDSASSFFAHVICGTAQYLAALPRLLLPSAKRALVQGRFSQHAPLGLFEQPAAQPEASHAHRPGLVSRAVKMVLSPLAPLVKLQLMLPVLASASAMAQVDWAAWRVRQLVAELLTALPGGHQHSS